jgi:hypothetical protein
VGEKVPISFSLIISNKLTLMRVMTVTRPFVADGNLMLSQQNGITNTENYVTVNLAGTSGEYAFLDWFGLSSSRLLTKT